MKLLAALVLSFSLATAQGQVSWQLNNAEATIATDNTVKLHLTAEAKNLHSDNNFMILYFNKALKGDTLVVQPYYFASMIGSGFPRTVTKVNELYLGYYLGRFKYICVYPYHVSDVDTATHTPTPHTQVHCLDLIKIKLSIPTTSSPAASIYPNPATDAVNIELKEQSATVSIYGLDRRVLHTQQYTVGKHRINLASLPKGVYVLSVVTSKGSLQRKIVKQ